MATSGGVDRDHDQSLGPKLAFFTLHAGLVIVCIWLAFGRFDWADPLRAKVLAGCALLYFLRHVLTLFVLLKRRVEMSEVFGLTVFMAVFEIGFLLLGAGALSDTATPFRWLDWVGIAMVIIGIPIDIHHLEHATVAHYYFDYNTVEIILIGTSIFLA